MSCGASTGWWIDLYSPECVEGEFSEVLHSPDPMRQSFLYKVSEVCTPILTYEALRQLTLSRWKL
jgi:hypothetical protein